MLPYRLIVALFSVSILFRVSATLRCKCTTSKGVSQCRGGFCDVHGTSDRRGACGAVRVDRQTHFACVHIKHSSNDTYCHVIRSATACWCRNQDFCNVDLEAELFDVDADEEDSRMTSSMQDVDPDSESPGFSESEAERELEKEAEDFDEGSVESEEDSPLDTFVIKATRFDDMKTVELHTATRLDAFEHLQLTPDTKPEPSAFSPDDYFGDHLDDDEELDYPVDISIEPSDNNLSSDERDGVHMSSHERILKPNSESDSESDDQVSTILLRTVTMSESTMSVTSPTTSKQTRPTTTKTTTTTTTTPLTTPSSTTATTSPITKTTNTPTKTTTTPKTTAKTPKITATPSTPTTTTTSPDTTRATTTHRPTPVTSSSSSPTTSQTTIKTTTIKIEPRPTTTTTTSPPPTPTQQQTSESNTAITPVSLAASIDMERLSSTPTTTTAVPVVVDDKPHVPNNEKGNNPAIDDIHDHIPALQDPRIAQISGFKPDMDHENGAEQDGLEEGGAWMNRRANGMSLSFSDADQVAKTAAAGAWRRAKPTPTRVFEQAVPRTVLDKWAVKHRRLNGATGSGFSSGSGGNTAKFSSLISSLLSIVCVVLFWLPLA